MKQKAIDKQIIEEVSEMFAALGVPSPQRVLLDVEQIHHKPPFCTASCWATSLPETQDPDTF